MQFAYSYKNVSILRIFVQGERNRNSNVLRLPRNEYRSLKLQETEGLFNKVYAQVGVVVIQFASNKLPGYKHLLWLW